MATKQAPSLQKLNRHLLRMNRRVAAAVDQAVACLINQDESLAREVLSGDDAIDNEEVRIEQECLDLLTEGQLPADQLRYALCIIKINSDLERIADCAVNIAGRLEGFVEREAPALPQDLRIMANSACGMLRDAMRAWVAQDPQGAVEVLRADEVVDALYDQLARDVTESLA
ncbi:MAG: PhoU domain-containing protein, partial [Phycisphaerae bacterium]|nr:PhoU domain-containing protein [Phycisphaerae bacterium]